MRYRTITSTDRDALADLFARMSPESRRLRYFSPKPMLTQGELRYLTQVDHVRHEAIAAHDEDGRILGIARYVQARSAGTVDIAVEVADSHQGHGLGSALVTRVMAAARDRGYTRFRASVLWENGPARSMMRSLGFRACSSSGGVVELYANGFAAMKNTATSTSTPSVTSAAM
jgi:RimJ/RimL family protein N-acetyltransferase